MTKSEALAKILQTYTEEQLRDFKDEPDTIVTGTWPDSAAISARGDDEGHAPTPTHPRAA